MAPATTHTTWHAVAHRFRSHPAQLRADDDSTYQSRLTSSYDNGLTNIARLQQLYPDSRRDAMAAPSLSIYVEGVGTAMMPMTI
jgi:hypothetical protein